MCTHCPLPKKMKQFQLLGAYIGRWLRHTFKPPTSFEARAKIFFVLKRSPVRFVSLAKVSSPVTMACKKESRVSDSWLCRSCARGAYQVPSRIACNHGQELVHLRPSVTLVAQPKQHNEAQLLPLWNLRSLRCSQ